MHRILLNRWTKVSVFILGLCPAVALVWYGLSQNLTANPVEFITHYTGDWTLRFLEIALAITPLRLLFKEPQFIRYRRMLGLFSFFYGCLHLLTWLLDREFSWSNGLADVTKRPYITVGMLGFSILLVLAITSTSGWVRRLTSKRWRRLHRLVYVSAAAGVIHYCWLVKSDLRLPLTYGAVLAVLLLYRVVGWARKRDSVVQPA